MVVVAVNRGSAPATARLDAPSEWAEGAPRDLWELRVLLGQLVLPVRRVMWGPLGQPDLLVQQDLRARLGQLALREQMGLLDR